MRWRGGGGRVAGSFKFNFSRLIDCSSHYNSLFLPSPAGPPGFHSATFSLAFLSLSLRLTSHSHFPKILNYPHSSELLLSCGITHPRRCPCHSLPPSPWASGLPSSGSWLALVPSSAWLGNEAARWGLTHSGALPLTRSSGERDC